MSDCNPLAANGLLLKLDRILQYRLELTGTGLGFCVRFCLTDPQKNHGRCLFVEVFCVELSEENLFRKFLLRRTNKQKGANKTAKAKLNARPLHVF